MKYTDGGDFAVEIIKRCLSGQNANGLKGERCWAKKKGRVDVSSKDVPAELTVCILLPSMFFSEETAGKSQIIFLTHVEVETFSLQKSNLRTRC